MSVLDLFNLDGRVVIVTGASSGLGVSFAQGFAEAGADLVLGARRVDRMATTATLVEQAGGRVRTCQTDVVDPDQCQQLVDFAMAEFGRVDILINNAGIQRRGPLHEFAHSDWQDIMQTNLNSVFFVGQCVAQHMIPRGRGRIINICSVQSELGRPGISPYMATKGAVKMLTKGMAIDWGPLGLNVNGIGPGYFKTELNEKLVNDPTFSAWLTNRTPSRRWGDVEELAGAAVFLASDAASFVNGHILYVDGGVTAQL